MKDSYLSGPKSSSLKNPAMNLSNAPEMSSVVTSLCIQIRPWCCSLLSFVGFSVLYFQVSIQTPSPHESLLRLPYSCSGRHLHPLGTTMPQDSAWLLLSAATSPGEKCPSCHVHPGLSQCASAMFSLGPTTLLELQCV